MGLLVQQLQVYNSLFFVLGVTQRRGGSCRPISVSSQIPGRVFLKILNAHVLDSLVRVSRRVGWVADIAACAAQGAGLGPLPHSTSPPPQNISYQRVLIYWE